MKKLSLTTEVFIESSEDVAILNKNAVKTGVDILIQEDKERQSGFSITIIADKKKRIKKFLLKCEFAYDKEDLQEFMPDIKEISEDSIVEPVNENIKSGIPSLNIMSSEPMELISGVRKNGSFYIVVHGTSPNDIKDFVKIPDSVIESSKDSGDKNDIAAVIQFAIENFKKML